MTVVILNSMQIFNEEIATAGQGAEQDLNFG